MWLVMYEEVSLSNIYFPIDSQVYVFIPVVDGIHISEIYNIDPGMEQVVRSYGSWKKNRDPTRLMLDPSPLFERRNNLMGLKLYAETLPEAPFAIVNLEDLATQN